MIKVVPVYPGAKESGIHIENKNKYNVIFLKKDLFIWTIENEIKLFVYDSGKIGTTKRR